jgi:hypothetical protein
VACGATWGKFEGLQPLYEGLECGGSWWWRSGRPPLLVTMWGSLGKVYLFGKWVRLPTLMPPKRLGSKGSLTPSFPVWLTLCLHIFLLQGKQSNYYYY